MKHEYHKMPKGCCTACGKKIDAASSLTAEGPPNPGDITICLDCGHIMAVADDLTPRNLTDAEIVEVAGDPDIIKTQKILALAKKYAPRKPHR